MYLLLFDERALIIGKSGINKIVSSKEINICEYTVLDFKKVIKNYSQNHQKLNSKIDKYSTFLLSACKEYLNIYW